MLLHKDEKKRTRQKPQRVSFIEALQKCRYWELFTNFKTSQENQV